MRRPGVAAAAKVPGLAAPGRSRPALDGHDDAAAEAQLGADELSVVQQAVTHHCQGRPKLLIGVAGQVHVVHDDDATLPKRGHSPAQLKIFPPGASAKIRSNWPSRPTASAPSPDSKRTHGGQRAESAACCTASSSSTVTTSTSWRDPEAMDQPGQPDADAGADLQDPATAGDRRGQGGQQPAHLDLAGQPETGSGGSLVRGQNVLGKLLALGHQTIVPSTRLPSWQRAVRNRPVQRTGSCPAMR